MNKHPVNSIGGFPPVFQKQNFYSLKSGAKGVPTKWHNMVRFPPQILSRRHSGFKWFSIGQVDLKVAVGGKIAIEGKLCFFGCIGEAGDHESVEGYQIAVGGQNGQRTVISLNPIKIFGLFLSASFNMGRLH